MTFANFGCLDQQNDKATATNAYAEGEKELMKHPVYMGHSMPTQQMMYTAPPRIFMKFSLGGFFMAQNPNLPSKVPSGQWFVSYSDVIL